MGRFVSERGRVVSRHLGLGRVVLSLGVRGLSSLAFLSILLMTGKGFEAVSCYCTMATMLSKKDVAMFPSFGGYVTFQGV